LKKGRRLINSKREIVDGINFASRIEAYMYRLLKKEGISFNYEGVSFLVLNPFTFPNESHERQGNNKGELINRGNKKMQGIIYTPDFNINHNEYICIIETKGLRTESFNMRLKLFKAHLTRDKVEMDIYIPHTQKECDKVIELIKIKINGYTKTN